MSDNINRSTLTQEIIRRLMNTSEMVPQKDRNEVIEKFIEKMERSGFSKDKIKEIVIAGLLGYERKKVKAYKEGKELHRSSKATMKIRIKKKLLPKTTLYRNRKEKMLRMKES